MYIIHYIVVSNDFIWLYSTARFILRYLSFQCWHYDGTTVPPGVKAVQQTHATHTWLLKRHTCHTTCVSLTTMCVQFCLDCDACRLWVGLYVNENTPMIKISFVLELVKRVSREAVMLAHDSLIPYPKGKSDPVCRRKPRTSVNYWSRPSCLNCFWFCPLEHCSTRGLIVCLFDSLSTLGRHDCCEYLIGMAGWSAVYRHRWLAGGGGGCSAVSRARVRAAQMHNTGENDQSTDQLHWLAMERRLRLQDRIPGTGWTLRWGSWYNLCSVLHYRVFKVLRRRCALSQYSQSFYTVLLNSITRSRSFISAVRTNSVVLSLAIRMLVLSRNYLASFINSSRRDIIMISNCSFFFRTKNTSNTVSILHKRIAINVAFLLYQTVVFLFLTNCV